jgi:hypothetical protein
METKELYNVRVNLMQFYNNCDFNNLISDINNYMNKIKDGSYIDKVNVDVNDHHITITIKEGTKEKYINSIIREIKYLIKSFIETYNTYDKDLKLYINNKDSINTLCDVFKIGNNITFIL